MAKAEKPNTPPSAPSEAPKATTPEKSRPRKLTAQEAAENEYFWRSRAEWLGGRPLAVPVEVSAKIHAEALAVELRKLLPQKQEKPKQEKPKQEEPKQKKPRLKPAVETAKAALRDRYPPDGKAPRGKSIKWLTDIVQKWCRKPGNSGWAQRDAVKEAVDELGRAEETGHDATAEEAVNNLGRDYGSTE